MELAQRQGKTELHLIKVLASNEETIFLKLKIFLLIGDSKVETSVGGVELFTTRLWYL